MASQKKPKPNSLTHKVYVMNPELNPKTLHLSSCRFVYKFNIPRSHPIKVYIDLIRPDLTGHRFNPRIISGSLSGSSNNPNGCNSLLYQLYHVLQTSGLRAPIIDTMKVNM